MPSDLILKSLELISIFGSIYFALVVLGVLLIKKDKKLPVLFIFSFLITTIITYGLKFAFQAPRPQPPTSPSPQPPFYDTSFPSGHSARGFLYAVFLSEKFNKYFQILFYALAILTAIGRVLTGDHFPIDVVAGSAIGLLISRLALKYQKQILKHLSF